MSVDSSEMGKRIRNFVVVAIAALLSIALVLGVQTRSPAASLSEMAEQSISLESAMANKKPTLIEFYANWCTSCQAMAPDIQALKESYRDRVNFVMLNVDNTKWLPEMLNYRVDGIPHFEFLSASSNEQGAAIGELPRAILAENLDALIAGQTLPYAQISGRISEIDTATNPLNSSDSAADPRSHGAQVSNQVTN
ncbi:thioredoxin family protein [cf. Phormidesmis sp. LEGE 11477]|uniref:thioredoxin family protein n=1 Tax=cf. Phormidesmis sp. LEGE 11477 TaxID=1828680 RepID=UPI001882AE69|nr:thioredoxin family protein [cf. Phormidesmis sp. LEGE 11477]MBE9060848.1 thioredoxin family protein [cf. Phormidesmis sp. LEGE 11477]